MNRRERYLKTLDALNDKILEEVNGMDDCNGAGYAGEFEARANGVVALAETFATVASIAQLCTNDGPLAD